MNPNIESKRKQYIIYGSILLLILILMIVVPSLFKKKTEEQITPKIDIVKPETVEEESFKAVYGTELTDLKQRNEELKKELESVKRALEEEKKRGSTQPPLPTVQSYPQPPEYIQVQQPYTLQAEQKPAAPAVEQLDNLIVLNKYEPPVTKLEEEKPASEQKVEHKVKIPAGSIAKAVLLSGMDAPTGGNARSQPHPALFRLMDYAILPNFFKSDIKNCFVIGNGYGDLSSERAYIRLATLSCVTNDGKVIEMPVHGYVTGEDGKVGLQGRVVTKQGQLLARTLIAGFLQGVAEAYKQSNTILQVSPTGTVSTVPPDKAAETGLYAGASSAAQKLADFYMKLVNEMYPVIEINAGRNVDLVFISVTEKEREQ